MIDLTGTWVCSFSSYVHDDPMDPEPAPQIAAYYFAPWPWLVKLTGNFYRQTAGYFLAATMLCLKFEALGADGKGPLSGKVKINRGGRVHKVNDAVTGEYTAADNVALGITEGTFYTIYSPPGAPQIRLDYKYIARSTDELDWVWWESTAPPLEDPFRASVAQGTLRRVL